MLPFTKRSVRSEDASELIKTGDIEVIPAVARRPQSAPPPRVVPSNRQPAFRLDAGDDDMTTLLPRKGMTFSPRSMTAGPRAMAATTPRAMAANPRAMAASPRAAPTMVPPASRHAPPRSVRPSLEDPPTRQFVRQSSPPPSLSPIAGPPRASNRPPPLDAQPAPQRSRAVGKAHAPVGSPANLKSDPRLDPPAAIITARNGIAADRPTISWAAALVAMGVFVGLITAVVARGDADTLIDAAASFVDPSGGHTASASVQASNIPTKAEEPRTTVLSSVDTLLPQAPVAGDPSASTGDGAAGPDRVAGREDATAAGDHASPRVETAPLVRRAPVAYAPRRAWHPAPRPAAREQRVAALPKAAPAPVAARAAPKPAAAKANDDDVESASAADALAKAQLEASLR